MAIQKRIHSVRCTDGRSFKVGDPISWSFNGDIYPGDVIAVSPSGKTITVQERSLDMKSLTEVTRKFTWRRTKGRATSGREGRFYMSGGTTWILSHGHQFRWNPEF